MDSKEVVRGAKKVIKMDFQQAEEKPSVRYRIKSFLRECWRVLRVTKKPTKEEFKTVVKVSGLGILIIGLIGFLIQMARVLLVK